MNVSTQAKIGLIGMGVMGENLALNIERNGYPIAVWNRAPDKVEQFIAGKARGKNVIGTSILRRLFSRWRGPAKS